MRTFERSRTSKRPSASCSTASAANIVPLPNTLSPAKTNNSPRVFLKLLHSLKNLRDSEENKATPCQICRETGAPCAVFYQLTCSHLGQVLSATARHLGLQSNFQGCPENLNVRQQQASFVQRNRQTFTTTHAQPHHRQNPPSQPRKYERKPG